MTSLKLLALDEEDLQVVSSLLQDAVVRVGDMAYLPSQKRFAALLNRFDWVRADEDGQSYRRKRAALRFDRVIRAQHKDLHPENPDRVLSLLAVQFETADAPGGKVTLVFSGNVSIQLDVECVEVEMSDLGPTWRTRRKPDHPTDGAPEPEESEATGA